ncbi:potassium transporter Kup [Sorangium sp. So ce693]|uniref:potassium transporter Kup n=1 Tax=Sorangium sp. So ce693 TaxID=3133318 RepID=UPI003F5E91A8
MTGAPRPERRATLVVAALGVVFGDIGTSPLYAFKECVHGEYGVAPTPENILGVLSLIFWSLLLVVTLKYLTFIMRADNRGEGGILALLALLPERVRAQRSPRMGWMPALAVFGAALLYGDGIITPAISVLSAVEGLGVATTRLQPAVVPITCAILLLLFGAQRWGTANVGRVFGPIMLLWFIVLALLGLRFIASDPSVLDALRPAHAVRFFLNHGVHGFALLGAVVLVITGAEALYADMGHFGRGPIRRAWYWLVLPALVLNYFGQGALLLGHPEAAGNPFFEMVPRGIPTYGLVALSTMATLIASQAIISGAFSLTHQAVQLGYFPWTAVKHTSSEVEGQVYVSVVNWALAVACVALVLGFKASSRLAAAYGIAVTGTMTITSVLFYGVARRTWRWPRVKALPLLVVFLAGDLAFFGATLLKLRDGGYIPLLVGAALFGLMAIWKRGRALLAEAVVETAPPLGAFLRELDAKRPARVPGTAVFLTSTDKTPPSLAHHLARNKVLHETAILLTVLTEHVPRVPEGERIELTSLGGNRFYRLRIRMGFMESPHVPSCLVAAAERSGEPFDVDDLTYYVGRETLLATDRGRMGHVAESIFAFMLRNAVPRSAYFELPPSQVVEIGLQIDL